MLIHLVSHRVFELDILSNDSSTEIFVSFVDVLIEVYRYWH